MEVLRPTSYPVRLLIRFALSSWLLAQLAQYGFHHDWPLVLWSILGFTVLFLCWLVHRVCRLEAALPAKYGIVFLVSLQLCYAAYAASLGLGLVENHVLFDWVVGCFALLIAIALCVGVWLEQHFRHW